MTRTDKTLRDLGQLYELYQEIKKARLKSSTESDPAVIAVESPHTSERRLNQP